METLIFFDIGRFCWYCL